ncbi:hypothetical protein HMPREF9441_02117 [Paraprevotella clara YIT 11840]|uniref:Uncharacterized protein n=1 Tax=Paraprevotella clara YIT 11840 TaxID=762968 RepID=G5SRW8_9BACT|nr:hypothetical protein HMPREF9441_02117 [Paraprevotella clara YIT 11840]
MSVSGDRSLSLKKRATITQSYRKKTDFNSIPKDFFSQHLKKRIFCYEITIRLGLLQTLLSTVYIIGLLSS